MFVRVISNSAGGGRQFKVGWGKSAKTCAQQPRYQVLIIKLPLELKHQSAAVPRSATVYLASESIAGKNVKGVFVKTVILYITRFAVVLTYFHYSLMLSNEKIQ